MSRGGDVSVPPGMGVGGSQRRETELGGLEDAGTASRGCWDSPSRRAELSTAELDVLQEAAVTVPRGPRVSLPAVSRMGLCVERLEQRRAREERSCRKEAFVQAASFSEPCTWKRHLRIDSGGVGSGSAMRTPEVLEGKSPGAFVDHRPKATGLVQPRLCAIGDLSGEGTRLKSCGRLVTGSVEPGF